MNTSFMHQAARWVSIVAHPFVMGLLWVICSASHFGGLGEAGYVTSIFVILAIAPVAVLMVYKVRRGSWKNVDASNRHERSDLFKVAILATLGIIVWFIYVHPTPVLVRGALGCLAMLLACAFLTRWIKLSLHVAFASLAGMSLLLIGSMAGWILLLLVPLLAWSRLVLARHNLAEILTGLLLGLTTAVTTRFM
jgi:hypothetical protein